MNEYRRGETLGKEFVRGWSKFSFNVEFRSSVRNFCEMFRQRIFQFSSYLIHGNNPRVTSDQLNLSVHLYNRNRIHCAPNRVVRIYLRVPVPCNLWTAQISLGPDTRTCENGTADLTCNGLLNEFARMFPVKRRITNSKFIPREYEHFEYSLWTRKKREKNRLFRQSIYEVNAKAGKSHPRNTHGVETMVSRSINRGETHGFRIRSKRAPLIANYSRNKLIFPFDSTILHRRYRE